MSLNFNYSLLKEGASNRFKVNTYNRMQVKPVYDRHRVLSEISHILEDAREDSNLLEPLGSFFSDEQYNAAITASIEKLNKTVDDSFEFMQSAITNVRKNIAARKVPNPDVIEYSPETFRKLDSCGITIAISDIRPNSNLIDPNSPCFDTLGDLFKDISDYIHDDTTVSLYDGGSYDSDYNDIAEYLDSVVDKVARGIHTPSVNSLGKSAEIYIFMPTQLYGSNEPKEQYINAELFFQAKKNVTNTADILKLLDALENNCRSGKSKVVDYIGQLTKRINNIAAERSISKEKKDSVYQTILKIVSKYNVDLSKIMSMYISAMIAKLNRIYRLYGPDCDSDKVYNKCINILIGNKLGQNEIVLGAENESYSEIMDYWTSAVALLNEASMEYNQYMSIYSILNEDGQQQSGNNNNNNNSGGGIINWIKNFINKIKEAIAKFFNKQQEIVTSNNGSGKWWAKNKEAFSKVNLQNITVKDYYEYDLDAILKDVDPSSFETAIDPIQKIETIVGGKDNLKDQESINQAVENLKNSYDNYIIEERKAVFNSLGFTSANPNFDTKESFTNEVLTAYRHNYIPKDGPAVNIKISATDVLNFVMQFENGLNKSIQAQSTATSAVADRIIQKLNAYLDQLQVSANTKTTNTNNNATKDKKAQSAAAQQPTTPANASPQTPPTQGIDNSAEFDLAKTFNISDTRRVSFLNEVEIDNVGNQPNVESINQTTYAALKAEVAKRVRVPVQCLGEALGARQQAAISAYQQYTAIAKSVIGSGTTTTTTSSDNQQ